MRATAKSTELKAAAYAGTYVVVLAWDTANGKAPARTNLLGYAIERAQFDLAGHEVERYWLRGIKRFKERDKGLPPGTPVSTAEHPIQSFLWADYTAKAATRYLYRIVPLYGTVKTPKLDEATAVALDITTEVQGDQPLDSAADSVRHDVFFNRGVIGSQAYAREFGNREPDAENPRSKEMKWLSRGLFEALLRFIGLAGDGMGLRAALYEFHYQPVANAFAKAIEAGADVKIVYDAESDYRVENEAAIKTARLDDYDAVIPRTVSEGIRHNKFIVLLKGGKPFAVWTGSTNISAGGIFGHSNVGHVVWDESVAAKYLDYWQRLADNLTPTKLRAPNKAATPTPAGKPPKNSVSPLFSARDDKESNETLQWYAHRLAEAKEVSCMTYAFNIDEVFQQVLGKDNDVLRYVVKDDPLGEEESIGQDRDVIFAAGAYLDEGALANFLRERSNPLNRNRYIHNKFMLVDPLSEDPLVVTGSANFSKPSQRTNDENMLVIRGNKRVADIYFGEFMRVFDHHYARYIVRVLTDQGRSDPEAGYLKEKTADWLPPHFNPASYKSKRRKYFVSPKK
ncbi:MAG TPA: phospholipase D-like domain-containing protein [Candidatus Polarisedimenticolia bacterium]|jgi:phosphatidylserine/phosphatidylglycerophosphate/cardiolipin synthase-like enzyme|nr:phospholipase D-like domain-containing protein [Candidatus Polarisedimenticolia bacterium]